MQRAFILCKKKKEEGEADPTGCTCAKQVLFGGFYDCMSNILNHHSQVKSSAINPQCWQWVHVLNKMKLKPESELSKKSVVQRKGKKGHIQNVLGIVVTTSPTCSR